MTPSLDLEISRTGHVLEPWKTIPPARLSFWRPDDIWHLSHSGTSLFLRLSSILRGTKCRVEMEASSSSPLRSGDTRHQLSPNEDV